MDILRRLFGGDEPRSRTAQSRPLSRQMSSDEQAVERYRYLLRTAPPETIEEAHAEAFAKLTPEERAAGAAYDEDPRSLARLATRAEMRQPGTLERTWSGMPAGMGMGGLMMGNFMSTIAGVIIGSAIADAFLGDAGYNEGSAEAADAPVDSAGAEGGDFAAGDSGFGDFGDFGGGDFGGGDF
jgi:hypothetical protein